MSQHLSLYHKPSIYSFEMAGLKVVNALFFSSFGLTAAMLFPPRNPFCVCPGVRDHLYKCDFIIYANNARTSVHRLKIKTHKINKN